MLINVGGAAEGVVPAAEYGGAVEADDGPRGCVGHVEGKAESVACCEEVGARVEMGGYVVWGLGGEEGEEGEVGCCCCCCCRWRWEGRVAG